MLSMFYQYYFYRKELSDPLKDLCLPYLYFLNFLLQKSWIKVYHDLKKIIVSNEPKLRGFELTKRVTVRPGNKNIIFSFSYRQILIDLKRRVHNHPARNHLNYSGIHIFRHYYIIVFRIKENLPALIFTQIRQKKYCPDFSGTEVFIFTKINMKRNKTFFTKFN